MPSARSRVVARSPELYAGCPQQVCARGTSTWQPACSSNRIAAKPTVGRCRSTRQVTNNATRGLPGGMSDTDQRLLHVPRLDKARLRDGDISGIEFDADAARAFQFRR